SSDQSAHESGLPFPLDGWRYSRNWIQSTNWEIEQRLRLAAAAKALEASIAGRETTLGEILDRLCSEHLSGESLVIDGAAMRQSGITALTSPVPGFDRNAPPWEAYGLTYIPCSAAPVLTTRRELEVWRGSARLAHRPETAVLSASLEEVIADAASHGHDVSGRFQLVTEWLHGGFGVSQEAGADSLQAVLGELHAEYWTEWEPLAGTDLESP